MKSYNSINIVNGGNPYESKVKYAEDTIDYIENQTSGGTQTSPSLESMQQYQSSIRSIQKNQKPTNTNQPIDPSPQKTSSTKKLIGILAFSVILYSIYTNFFSKPSDDLLLDKSYKNICLNGKDKTKLSFTQQLSEFIKGPCSPVVLVPGSLATKLRMEINCEELQENDPETFESCNWNTCQDNGYWPFSRKPLNEYDVWLPEILSPFSMFYPSDLTMKDTCYYKLTKTHYNFTKEAYPDNVVIQKPGVRVSWFGDTPETNSYNTSKCGMASFESLGTGYKDNIYKKMVNFFDHMGYTSGLTFQPIPVDWRITLKINPFRKKFKPILKKLKRITGKKSAVITHSAGGIHVIINLTNLVDGAEKWDQKDKDELITHWTAIFTPFGGCSWGIKAYISMFDKVNLWP